MGDREVLLQPRDRQQVAFGAPLGARWGRGLRRGRSQPGSHLLREDAGVVPRGRGGRRTQVPVRGVLEFRDHGPAQAFGAGLEGAARVEGAARSAR